MDDWQKFIDMPQARLFSEIQKMRSKMMLIRPNSPMFRQIMDIIDTADMVYQDKLAAARLNADKEPDVLDIGEIESVVKEFEDTDALTLAVITAYTTQLRDNK